MRIDRKSSVPIYSQIKNYILDEIKKGNLKTGDKLPTEREFSQQLKVSRNTISTAFNLLEQEGVLVSYQGRGTFVAEEDTTWQQERGRTQVIQLVDIALEKAAEIGLNTKEFISLAQERVREKEEFIRSLKAVFIECNIEQASFFAEELSRIININIEPATVADLKKSQNNLPKTIKDANVIITTFNHVNEIKELIGDSKQKIIGVANTPSLETIVKIARYPKGTKFGQISISQEFHFKIKHALKLAGLDDIDMKYTTSTKQEEILDIIDNSHVIVVSPGRLKDVKKLVGNHKDIISFNYVLDPGSIKSILSKILKI